MRPAPAPVVTLLLHCCYTFVTLLVYCCYTVVTLLLNCCYSVVTVLLHCCYSVITLLLHCCYNFVPTSCGTTARDRKPRAQPAPPCLWCYNYVKSSVSVVLQWCYSGVTVVLQ
jgi:hypothetical protein